MKEVLIEGKGLNKQGRSMRIWRDGSFSAGDVSRGNKASESRWINRIEIKIKKVKVI